MRHLLTLALIVASISAQAIVIRHDVDDQQYRITEADFPALVDLPHEGHGVLIAPQWIVTAAHATQWHPVEAVMLDGDCREVERLIVHPGYKAPPKELLSGDSSALMAHLAASDDIALIKLAQAIPGVRPVPLYRGDDEVGKRAMLIGKGATGNGAEGQYADGSHRTAMRRAYNEISSVDDRWLGYVFDDGASAVQLEGMLGNGDSGGPVLLDVNGQWHLAGLAARQYWEGDLADFHPGTYGQASYQVRISRYASWIEQVMQKYAQPESDDLSGKDAMPDTSAE